MLGRESPVSAVGQTGLPSRTPAKSAGVAGVTSSAAFESHTLCGLVFKGCGFTVDFIATKHQTEVLRLFDFAQVVPLEPAGTDARC